MVRMCCDMEGCKRRIKLVDQIIAKCYCGKNFCSKHRLPELHDCKHEFKIDKDVFIKENKCIACKIAIE